MTKNDKLLLCDQFRGIIDIIEYMFANDQFDDTYDDPSGIMPGMMKALFEMIKVHSHKLDCTNDAIIPTINRCASYWKYNRMLNDNQFSLQKDTITPPKKVQKRK